MLHQAFNCIFVFTGASFDSWFIHVGSKRFFNFAGPAGYIIRFISKI
jgi:hypothetical protein